MSTIERGRQQLKREDRHEPSTIYVDVVEFDDGSTPQEMRHYRESDFSDGWAVWIWSDETLRIPTRRIKSVSTIEEG